MKKNKRGFKMKVRLPDRVDVGEIKNIYVDMLSVNEG
jgi:hypothetical protein